MYTIILSDEAFRVIISSALEAYAAPFGRRKDAASHIPLETIGALWGYGTEAGADTYYHVVAADVETAAHRQPDQVTPKKESIDIRHGFYQFLNPELQYLGDFHSHPWRYGEEGSNKAKLESAQHLERQRLYRFSGQPGDLGKPPTGDFAAVASSLNTDYPYRVGLVATIYKMANQVLDPLHSYLDNYSAFRFTYLGPDGSSEMSSFRCWVKAYVFPEGSSIPVPDEDVQLQCAAVGFLPKIDFLTDNFQRKKKSALAGTD